MNPPALPGREPPKLRGIRRLTIVGACALLMVAMAIAASLFELRHDRAVRHQYEDGLAMTHLAFDAQSLATRMRGLQDRAAQLRAAGADPAADGTLGDAVRGVDIDRSEWERRVADALERELPADGKPQLGRLQAALASLAAALHADLHRAADAAVPGEAAAPAAPAAADADSDRAFLATVEAAQSALLASVRAGSDRAVLGRYTASEVAAAVVVVASLLALVLGAALAVLLNQAQHENRAAIGVMGELLRTDPLTGITNRRGLDENLPVEMARAKRSGTTLTVAMLDLDYFKRYNSRRGHAGGDSLLRIAAQSWRKQLRPTDTLVRYGGEEFTLVLPQCDSDQACQLIARLRPVLPDNQTFSAGVATWDYRESGDELLRRADQSLLAAKKQGRNRTVVSGRSEQIALDLGRG
jgi:diguanylate cyclase (GGDEF)-like protein